MKTQNARHGVACFLRPDTYISVRAAAAGAMVGFSRRVFLCIVVLGAAITQPCYAGEMKVRSEEPTNTLVLGVKHILDELIEDVRLAKTRDAVKNSSTVPWDTTYRVDGEEPSEDDSANAEGILLVSEFVVEEDEIEDNFKTTVQGLAAVPVRSWQENATQVAIDADTDTPVPPSDVVLGETLNITDDVDMPVLGETLLPPLNTTDANTTSDNLSAL